MAPLADEKDWNQLMRQVAEQRDRAAFALIARGFAGRLKGFLRKRGLNEEDAEELLQQLLVRIWLRAKQFDPAAGTLSAWLFRIARNMHIDFLRRQGGAQRAAPLLEQDAVEQEQSQPCPEQLTGSAQRAEQVKQALAVLPERQRQVVHMAFYQAKTHAEIAAELDMPLGSVKSNLRLAFNKLRSSMEESP